eukprot:CAMPEP_0172728536 /NCGR_PEP_ID=MMETSP1074-20121228/92299_1 /TAXON_ID=2916 /ORGANISM="Ceratium fusus, Strain PA161109" /LENGTH=187 /DNA_ID=CAMNT_0013555797 /DNA_START=1016 /DNA_END=1579 /DNA_ORIENTATION=+
MCVGVRGAIAPTPSAESAAAPVALQCKTSVEIDKSLSAHRAFRRQNVLDNSMPNLLSSFLSCVVALQPCHLGLQPVLCTALHFSLHGDLAKGQQAGHVAVKSGCVQLKCKVPVIVGWCRAWPDRARNQAIGCLSHVEVGRNLGVNMATKARCANEMLRLSMAFNASTGHESTLQADATPSVLRWCGL